MYKFLDIYIPLRLNHEEIENLNKPMTNKEIESVIKKNHQRKAQDLMVSLLNSAKHLNN
jgi:hypothetical protein